MSNSDRELLELAATDAADSARDAERVEQQKILDEIRQEQPK
jgi:hypothetical protein